jgi:hypothetical protein
MERVTKSNLTEYGPKITNGFSAYFKNNVLLTLQAKLKKKKKKATKNPHKTKGSPTNSKLSREVSTILKDYFIIYTRFCFQKYN